MYMYEYSRGLWPGSGPERGTRRVSAPNARAPRKTIVRNLVQVDAIRVVVPPGLLDAGDVEIVPAAASMSMAEIKL